MKDVELLQQMLAVEKPWQVVKVRDDLGVRQVDVWIGEQSGRGGWFFGSRPAVASGPEQVWRHLNLGAWRCFVHVPMSLSAEALAGQSWCGEAEMPLTRALARQVFGLLGEGMKFPAICSLLDLRADDLWKFKHGLDNGKVGVAPEVQAISTVPAADDPIWERLLDGSLEIDIRVLGLKLLLTKLREQMRVITDTEVRVLKAYEMQRYFARYERMLGHELAQLRQN